MRMVGEEDKCGDLFDDIDDLLDFPVEHLDIVGDADLLPGEAAGNWAAAGDTSPDFSFAADKPAAALVLPEGGSELDWLSNFVEESFSAGGGMVVGAKSEFQTASPVSVLERGSVPGAGDGKPTPLAAVATKSRDPGKRSSRPPTTFLSSLDLLPGAKKRKKKSATTAKAVAVAVGSSAPAPAVTECMHCKATKTPQWRMGPLGPKTLCNACGVRFFSGRLFPEYRPSASPTFVAAVHSNFHAKVVEMRVKSAQKVPPPAPVPLAANPTPIPSRSTPASTATSIELHQPWF